MAFKTFVTVSTLCALTLSGPAALAAYNFQVQLQKADGKLLKSEVQIQDGEQGTVEFEDTKVEFLPAAVDSRKISVTAKIYRLENGKYVLSTKPNVVTKFNHQASISELNAEGQTDYTLRFVPTHTETETPALSAIQ